MKIKDLHFYSTIQMQKMSRYVIKDLLELILSIRIVYITVAAIVIA